MRIEAALGGAHTSRCAFWPMINGPTLDPDWDFPDGGQRVALGQMAELPFEVKSWQCDRAYATMFDQSGNPKAYSGLLAHNNNTSGLGIKEVWVESFTPDWAETFWTVYEGADCTGKSAILPVKNSYLQKWWRDYLEIQLGQRRWMRFRSFMPAWDEEEENYDLRLLSVGGNELQKFLNPRSCKNITEAAQEFNHYQVGDAPMHNLDPITYGVSPVQPAGFYDEERMVDLVKSLTSEIVSLRDDLVETNTDIFLVDMNLRSRIMALGG